MPVDKSSDLSTKQGQLRFPSLRAASSNAGRSGGKGKALSRASSSDAAIGSVIDERTITSVPQKRKLGLENGKQKTKKAKRLFDSREGEENSQESASLGVEPSPQKLHVGDVRWQKAYFIAREKMGNSEPIHAQGQNKIHHILRVFDLSYEYGPCIGVSRLERWQRADALGLEPPLAVKEILLTNEGLEEDEYKQCVFHEFGV